ncbi:hypothetical protein Poli38472_007989 [Pythium oligandrum]|uniref:MYND-type domain-containing protein n=1 Tax=Pythium oligandrum TaxID=41045 RepID=A0A8K1CKV9_PYTOL|nr:hypothetical protein Poli38472_007989 [Pythium oligandrum]|eukprot:TMW65347.1 hypothetical protein Poli38472_007989 [Pythium oligandrum]
MKDDERHVWIHGGVATHFRPLSRDDKSVLSIDKAHISSSSRLLRVRVRQRQKAARLLCLSWSNDEHSRWFPDHEIVFTQPISHTEDLFGGKDDASFARANPSVSLWSSASTGRLAVATTALSQGSCVLRATAFAVGVHDHGASSFCHWCFSRLSKKAFRCGGCSFALYCSHKCLEADAPLHDFQCQVLPWIRQRQPAPLEVDNETLRLVLSILSMEQLIQTTTALAKLHIPPRKRRKDLKHVAHGLQRVIQSTTNVQIPLEHIVETIERVQTNAHPLYLNGATICGLGIFPEAAMTLNHSCSPNVVPSFDPATRTLRFYAIRDIQRLDMIEYSYLSDLSIGVKRRRETLKDGFGFECHCLRCETEARRQDGANDDTTENQVLTQLMATLQDDKASANLESLRREVGSLLERRSDLAFAFDMVELRRAVRRLAWQDVTRLAQGLLDQWRAQGLPEHYPTTETLYQQLLVAAKRLGDTRNMTTAQEAIRATQQNCGYVLPPVEVSSQP